MRSKIKDAILVIAKYVLLVIILLCIYISLLMLTSLIPSKYLERNVIESSEVLEKDGERKTMNLGYKTENVFTFSDALMINIAYSIDYTTPFDSSMLARKNYIPGQTVEQHIDSQYNLGASEEYINKENGDIYQTKELYGLMHGENITDSFEYARYWHGYLVLLRPLLVITNLEGIRLILLILTILLLATCLYKLYKKINLTVAVIFLIGLLSVSILSVTQGINDINVFLIAIIFMIILLSKKDIKKNIGEIFFIIGSLTSFIDLLTAPLITIGLPLITYLLLLQKEEEKLKDVLLNMIKMCFLWGIGYSVTWAAKWVITQLILGRPIISQALEQARYRSNLNNSRLSYLDVLIRNFNDLSGNVLIVLIILIIVLIIYNLKLNYKKEVDFKMNFKQVVPYVITAIMPFVWYFIMQNHSYIHTFFTYRILILTIINTFITVNILFKTEKSIK